MSENIPEWAIEKACKLANAEADTTHNKWLPKDVDAPHTFLGHRTLRALALYIAEHEEAPVDPLLECLRETFGGCAPEFFAAFKAALECRGLKIVEA